MYIATVATSPESALRIIDHLVFRVADLDATERFYSAVLCQTPERDDGSLMYSVGATRLFFTLPDDSTLAIAHDKERIGLNHLAFGVRSLEELQAIAARLTEQEIANSGIVLDHYGAREFIWLDDPNGMRIEFYLRTNDSSGVSNG
jgi:glyoxylase I family protein